VMALKSHWLANVWYPPSDAGGAPMICNLKKPVVSSAMTTAIKLGFLRYSL